MSDVARVTLVDATGRPDESTARVLRGHASDDDGAVRRRAAESPMVTELPPGGGGRRRVEVVVDGWRFELEVEDATRADLRRRATRDPAAAETSGPTEIRAIIPGRVAAVRVAPGDVVATGDTLLVVEAMKMQNELRATRPGTVRRIAVGEGQTIESGDILVVVE